MTQPEQAASLHPVSDWHRRRYLLRYWRYVEARRLLLRDLPGWARRPVRRLRAWLTGQPSPPPLPPDLPLPALLAWLRPDDILLDADGAELFWLERLLAGPVRPAIVYRSDIRRTARFTCHPVETVWLLEGTGYRVRLLTAEGPVARPAGWCDARPAGAPAPWLLATPPGREETAP